MKILRNLGLGLVAVLVLLTGVILGLFLVSRSADGPMFEMLPGGPFQSGVWVDPLPSDWSFVAAHQIVELESDERSRKTWILTVDGDAYIPASLAFPPLKTWHERALLDPGAVVRIDGKRHAVYLARIEDPALEARLGERVKEKYGGPPVEGGGAWFFRLDPVP